MSITYAGKEIPCLGTYDVLVAGGGFAGFSAAVSAARLNARVILIERSSRLGGTAVLAGVPNFCTSGGQLDGRSQIFDEILTKMRSLKAIGLENGYEEKYNTNIHTRDYGFSAPILECVLLDIALRAGIDILFQTDVIDVIGNNGNINYAVIQNESLHQAICAHTFIDATGSGILSMLGGGQSLQNDDLDEFSPIPPAFRVYLHKTHENTASTAQPFLEGAPHFDYKANKRPDGTVTLKMNLTGESTLTAEKRNSIELRVRNDVLAIVNNFSRTDGDEYRFDGTPEYFPVRESRRIRGDYVLTVSDVRQGAHFDDAIANCDFIIDTVHRHETVPEYQIPYRCLLVKNTENLLVIGRCFSADRGAMSSARTMTTASQMGLAAGTAAAISAKKQVALRSVSAKEIISTANTLKHE